MPAFAFSQDSPGVLASASGVTVQNTAVETTLMSGTLLGGSMRAGDVFAMQAYGNQDYAANQGTITFRMKLGTLNLWTSTGTQGASANTATPWYLQSHAMLDVAGASGTIRGGGFGRYFWSADNTGKFDVDGSAINAAANLNADLVYALTVQMSVANAGNIIRFHLGAIRLEKL
jgi:uncharacterized protein YgiB involved in biofilm formation